MKQISLPPTMTERLFRTCFLVFFLLPALSAFSATDYGFYFAKQKVTSENCANIPHNDVFTEGTAIYDHSTHTLTLTNVKVSRTGSDHNVIDNYDNGSLTVKFVGNCRLFSRDDYAIITRRPETVTSSSHTTFLVEGTATIESTNKSAIYFDDKTYPHGSTFNGSGTLNVISTNSYAIEGKSGETYFSLNFYNLTATLQGGKGALHNFYTVQFWKDAALTLKATNNSNYPIVSQADVSSARSEDSFDNWSGTDVQVADQIIERRPSVIVQPWGAVGDNTTIKYNNSSVCYEDIVITTRYKLLVIKQFFPDNYFRSRIKTLYPKMYITESEANSRTSMDVSSKSIASLEGIRFFPNLKTFYCQNNQLSTLDLSKNTALTTLDCSNNYLLSINGLANSPLVSLNCSGNQLTTFSLTGKSSLTSLDIRNNPYLTELNCNNNSLKTLYVSGCTKLATINCSYNKFTTLSATGLSKLATLNCQGNSSMTELYCYNNALTSLNVSYCTALNAIYCYGNNFSELDVSNRSALATLDCHGNTLLTTLSCNNCALTSLNVSGCNNLAKLYCKSNKFEDLYINNLPKLSVLDCSSNSLLWYLNCSDNALTTLSLTNCSELRELNCQTNAFQNLQVTGLPYLYAVNCNYNPNLVSLTCDNNALESNYLEVYECTALKTLSCKNNKLTSIDISDCGNLQTLSFDNNKFRSINLTQNADLRTLSCADNLLNNLDLSNNPMLTSLKCSSNNINSLDLSNKGHLEQLECQYNGLNSLSLEGCNNLVSVDCSNNNLTSLVMPQSSFLKTLYCYANKISGPNMNALVASLFNRRYMSVSGVFRVFTSSSLEGNVCTTTNVSNAWEKNWQAYWNNGSSWQVYDGASLPTSVTAVVSEDDSAPLYNLSGQRVGDGYKGLVIRNGRKVRK